MMVIKFVRLRWVAGCAWGRELVLQLGRILNRTRVQFLYKLFWLGSLGYTLIRFFFLKAIRIGNLIFVTLAHIYSSLKIESGLFITSKKRKKERMCN
jgi:hypothetical protein